MLGRLCAIPPCTLTPGFQLAQAKLRLGWAQRSGALVPLTTNPPAASAPAAAGEPAPAAAAEGAAPALPPSLHVAPPALVPFLLASLPDHPDARWVAPTLLPMQVRWPP